ncbi:hypothetical protein ACTND9_23065 [Paenibacillus barengoltzii]|uniref:hypothetical protein n=1 Tax=Paenibacillus barengoltzii TaxID=343517 RepID=UPI003F8CA1AB
MSIYHFVLLLLRLRKPKWRYGDALREMWQHGHYKAFNHLLIWVNKNGRKGGWDGNFRKTFPQEAKLLWP